MTAQAGDEVYLLKVRLPNDGGMDTTIHATRLGAERMRRETNELFGQKDDRLTSSIAKMTIHE